jgi:membrane protein
LFSRYLSILKDAFFRWNAHNATRMGASIAFYALFSMAPLLLFVVAIASVVFGQGAAQDWILQHVHQLVGQQGTRMVHTLLENQRHRSGLLASSIGFATLLFGASGVFNELHDALNTIWEVSAPPGYSWKEIIKGRVFAFVMVITVAFVLLILLIISACIAAISKYFNNWIPFPPILLELGNFLFSLMMIAVLFALIFKYVPQTRISWQDVWMGSVFTSLLFTIGKSLLGIYLGEASVGSAYGAAGSLVAVVAWVYYSAQIFLYGAEFTWMYAKKNVDHLPKGGEAGRQSPPQQARTASA